MKYWLHHRKIYNNLFIMLLIKTFKIFGHHLKILMINLQDIQLKKQSLKFIMIMI